MLVCAANLQTEGCVYIKLGLVCVREGGRNLIGLSGWALSCKLSLMCLYKLFGRVVFG